MHCSSLETTLKRKVLLNVNFHRDLRTWLITAVINNLLIKALLKLSQKISGLKNLTAAKVVYIPGNRNEFDQPLSSHLSPQFKYNMIFHIFTCKRRTLCDIVMHILMFFLVFQDIPQSTSSLEKWLPQLKTALSCSQLIL